MTPLFSKLTGKREALAQALLTTRLFSLSRLFSSRRLTIFNYHRIAAGDPALEPFDSSTFGPDQEGFRKELLLMKSHADPISESDLMRFLDSAQPLPKHSFMITFDDGYRDNYERALPVLKELKIPAIFFIPTQAICERRLGWWDNAAWILKRTKKESISFRGQTLHLRPSMTLAAEIVFQQMKSSFTDETDAVLQELMIACDGEMPPLSVSDRELMTWDQIREAGESLVSIGSHTETHRILSSLDLDTQRSELARSKEILETQLGKAVHSIAYPVGGYEHFNIETKKLAEETGYKLAFSFHTGASPLSRIDRFDITRVAPTLSPATFSGIFCLPQVFARRACASARPLPCMHA